jgi:hypothetical protein
VIVSEAEFVAFVGAIKVKFQFTVVSKSTQRAVAPP